MSNTTVRINTAPEESLGNQDPFMQNSLEIEAPITAVAEGVIETNGQAQDGQYIGPVAEGAAGIPLGLHILPKDPNAPILVRMRCVVQQAMDYALACGVEPELVAKFPRLFLGQFAPCSLVVPYIYICCVNESVRQRDRYLGHTTGKMIVRPKGGREQYVIELNPLTEEQTQWTFVIGVEREGGVKQNGESDFLSHSIVFPQTKGSLALAVAVDLNREQGEDDTGDTFQFVPSRRIYNQTVQNKTTGQSVRINRLDTLHFGTNLANLAARAAFDAGFPFDKARVNRMSRTERQAALTRARFGSQPGLPPASTNGGGTVIEDINDPFAVA